MIHDPLFSKVCLYLLNNQMVCAATDLAAYEYLLLETNAQRVNDHMMLMERKLISTEDNKVFFLGYRDPSEPEHLRVIKGQFKLVASELETLVRWLRFATNTNPSGRPISPGDVLSDSVLISSIDHSHTQLQCLKEIASSSMVGSKSADAKIMIRAVMKKLTEMGYFVPVGQSGTQYRATGKWSWLYDVMAFIRSHEDLPDVTGADEQMGLL